MDIKKIILEEMDNLQWMRSVPTPITSCDELTNGMRVKVTSNWDELDAVDQPGTIRMSTDEHGPNEYSVVFDYPFGHIYSPDDMEWFFRCIDLDGVTTILLPITSDDNVS